MNKCASALRISTLTVVSHVYSCYCLESSLRNLPVVKQNIRIVKSLRCKDSLWPCCYSRVGSTQVS